MHHRTRPVPPPCFTVGTVQSLWWSLQGSHQIMLDLILSKQISFGFIWQRMCYQHSSGFLTFSLARINLVVWCCFVRNCFLLKRCDNRQLFSWNFLHTVWSATETPVSTYISSAWAEALTRLYLHNLALKNKLCAASFFSDVLLFLLLWLSLFLLTTITFFQPMFSIKLMLWHPLQFLWSHTIWFPTCWGNSLPREVMLL